MHPLLLAFTLANVLPLSAQMTAAEKSALVGDSPADPDPRATLSPTISLTSVRAAARLVAGWQLARVESKGDAKFSQDWTIATMYAGFMAASRLLDDPKHAAHVHEGGEHYARTLGPRRTHADDQAIG